jgi:HSP20 family protein
MAITRWEPFGNALSVRDAMNRLFDQSVWWPMGQELSGFQVPMDVYTDGEGYVVEVALPGVRPEDINVEMTGHTLTISGEYRLEAPEGRNYLLRQRQGGKFQTSFTLPDAADAGQIQASYEHGLLRLHVPKTEAAKPKRIALKAGK